MILTTIVYFSNLNEKYIIHRNSFIAILGSHNQGDPMSNSFSRDFKGIWIPKELWFDSRLTPDEKVLAAEIDSLDHEKDHCYARNAYFAAFFQCNERKIKEMISKLKKLGFISEVSFDGRTRKLQSHLKTIYTKFSTSEVREPCREENSSKQNLTPPIGNISHPSPIGEFIEPDNIEDNTEEPPNPLKGEVLRTPPDEIKKSFGKFVKLNEDEYKTLCTTLGESKVKDLIDKINDYLASLGKKEYKDYAATIRNWARKESSYSKSPIAKESRAQEDRNGNKVENPLKGVF